MVDTCDWMSHGSPISVAAAEAKAADGFFDGLMDRATESAKRKAQDRVNQRMDQTIDKAIDKSEDAVKCLATDQECLKRAKKTARA